MATEACQKVLAVWFLHPDDSPPDSGVFEDWMEGALHVQEVLRNEHPAYLSAHMFARLQEEDETVAAAAAPALVTLVQFRAEAAQADAVLTQCEPLEMALELGHAAGVRSLLCRASGTSVPMAAADFEDADAAVLCFGDGAADTAEAISISADGRAVIRTYTACDEVNGTMLCAKLQSPPPAQLGLALGVARAAAPSGTAAVYRRLHAFSRDGPTCGMAVAQAMEATAAAAEAEAARANAPVTSMREVD